MAKESLQGVDCGAATLLTERGNEVGESRHQNLVGMGEAPRRDLTDHP